MLTITSDNILGKFVVFIPTTLDSADLEVLAPKRSKLLPGYALKTPLHFKLSLLPGHVGFLMPKTSRQGKESPF